MPAVDVVCDAGPGEYDDAGFQNEKHTKIVCFLFYIDNRIGTESRVEIAVSSQNGGKGATECAPRAIKRRGKIAVLRKTTKSRAITRAESGANGERARATR